MSDVSCQHCKLCIVHDDGEVVECRRYPPENIVDEMDDGVSIVFPLVRLDLWCGEFSRRLN